MSGKMEGWQAAPTHLHAWVPEHPDCPNRGPVAQTSELSSLPTASMPTCYMSSYCLIIQLGKVKYISNLIQDHETMIMMRDSYVNGMYHTV